VRSSYQTKTGQRGLVYFADLGHLDHFPYRCLNKDEGVGEDGGEKEEILQISQLDEMKAVWLFCWDYGMVQTGQSARFKDRDVRLTLSNAAGKQIAMSIDTGEKGERSLLDFEIKMGEVNYGFGINGVLGMDFLYRTGAVIDLKKMTLTF